MESFAVHEDHTISTATTHLATCPYIMMHGGSKTNPPNTEYHNNIKTIGDAWDIAEQSRKRTARLCKGCRAAMRRRATSGHRCIR